MTERPIKKCKHNYRIITHVHDSRGYGFYCTKCLKIKIVRFYDGEF